MLGKPGGLGYCEPLRIFVLTANATSEKKLAAPIVITRLMTLGAERRRRTARASTAMFALAPALSAMGSITQYGKPKPPSDRAATQIPKSEAARVPTSPCAK